MVEFPIFSYIKLIRHFQFVCIFLIRKGMTEADPSPCQKRKSQPVRREQPAGALWVLEGVSEAAASAACLALCVVG